MRTYQIIRFAQDDVETSVRGFWTYILASKSGVWYVGMTNDLERRMAEHKTGSVPDFSTKYNCNRLVWYEAFPTASQAIEMEKKIKGWRQEKKLTLVVQMNPAWADLSIAATRAATDQILSAEVRP